MLIVRSVFKVKSVLLLLDLLDHRACFFASEKVNLFVFIYVNNQLPVSFFNLKLHNTSASPEMFKEISYFSFSKASRLDFIPVVALWNNEPELSYICLTCRLCI